MCAIFERRRAGVQEVSSTGWSCFLHVLKKRDTYTKQPPETSRKCPSKRHLIYYYEFQPESLPDIREKRTPAVAEWREEDSGSEAGSYLRLIDVCITQLKPRRRLRAHVKGRRRAGAALAPAIFITLKPRVE